MIKNMRRSYSLLVTSVLLSTSCTTAVVNEEDEIEVIADRKAAEGCELLNVVSGHSSQGYNAVEAVNGARRNAARTGANAILVTSSSIGKYGAITVNAEALNCKI